MLRQLRQDSGKTTRDVAEWLDVGDSAVSKIEKARTTIKAQTIRALCQLYDVDASTTDTLLRLAKESNERGWWAAYRDTLPEWVRQLVGLEVDALNYWSYQSEYVPGLLQTSGYARAIMRNALPGISDGELDRRVALRRERQEQLEIAQPPTMNFYLNEAVLRRSVGGPDVMRGQLEHLIASADREHIVLRHVPFSAGEHPAMSNSFVTMQFPEEDGPAFVYVEHERGSIYQEDPGDIDHYLYVVSELDRVAASPEDTRALMVEIASSR